MTGRHCRRCCSHVLFFPILLSLPIACSALSPTIRKQATLQRWSHSPLCSSANPSTTTGKDPTSCSSFFPNNEGITALVRGVPTNLEKDIEVALRRQGIHYQSSWDEENTPAWTTTTTCEEFVVYQWNAAAGMLKLQPTNSASLAVNLPRWIPLLQDQETVLVRNGWSFLDHDDNDNDNEPMSKETTSASQWEGTYSPKWNTNPSVMDQKTERVSSLGFALDFPNLVEDLALERLQTDLARRVLLEGATDPPGLKRTHNGHDWTGSMTDKKTGIFTCALTLLPLFSSTDLMPTTASSGWLSFARPLAKDHVLLFNPTTTTTTDTASSLECDLRTEVLCRDITLDLEKAIASMRAP